MTSRQHNRKTRQRIATTVKRKAIRSATGSRRAQALERAHLTCLLCGRKGDVEVPVGTLLASAPHEFICTDCLVRHPAIHNETPGQGDRAGFKVIGRDDDSNRVLVVHAIWDPTDRRRGLAPCWIFDTRTKKGWGPLPVLAVTRSGAWREWSPADKDARKLLVGFSAIRKDLRPPMPEAAQPAAPPAASAAQAKAAKAAPKKSKGRAR